MNRQIPVELPEGYIDFFKKLENWQNEQQIKLKKQQPVNKIDAIALLKERQKPIVSSSSLAIDTTPYKTLYIDLIVLLKEWRIELTEVMDKIIDKLDMIDFEKLPEKMLKDDFKYFEELSVKIDVAFDLFLFTVDHALRPIIRLYAEPCYAEIYNDEFNSWHYPGNCPFCGSKSHISRLRADDGRRFMFCDRCFTEWETQYLSCIYCGNKDPKSIQYISIENDKSYQLYTCDKCKGYLKTYDERNSGLPTDLFIANIETIYLDMLAQQKGYNTHDSD